MANQIYCLLVGIDRYENPREAPHLRGCVADVTKTADWLVNSFGVPHENIQTLLAPLDGNVFDHMLPTRANIIRGWREHLAQAGAGDQVFFNYSGHGSQARSVDSNELDGLDETLVPQDGRTNNVYDILDKELGTLIGEVEARGAQVAVFLDCCHSGHGTRSVKGFGDDVPMARQCMPDLRERSEDSLIDGFDFSLVRSKGTRSIPPAPTHLLLAGCRDAELANEYRSPEMVWHGAATYFFHEALAGYYPGMTWAEIYEVVRSRVQAVYPEQLPQLEGRREMLFLGGVGDEVEGEVSLMLEVTFKIIREDLALIKAGNGKVLFFGLDKLPFRRLEIK